jgi:DNA helicase-2/ATP-dependent DNA helicase PcrA
VFPNGWRAAALSAADVEGTGGGEQETLAATLTDPTQRSEYERLAGERITLAAHLLERDAEQKERAGEAAVAPKTVSVSNLINYAMCPKRFYWTSVRPLPQFSGPAARIGTQVHAWIERRAGGQTSLIETDDRPDLTSEELAGEPGKIERLEKAFTESRFGALTPMYAERPFLLLMDGIVVNGRIDAIYGEHAGEWEIVDYKTGRVPEAGDPISGLQLDLYALACVDVFGKRPEDLTLTYLYLSEGVEVSRPAGDIEEIRSRVTASLKHITAGEFTPTPGPQCRYCDFSSFCDEGKTYLREQSGDGR